MDTVVVKRRVKKALSGMTIRRLSVRREDHDLVRIQVVSDTFYGMPFVKRINEVQHRIAEFAKTVYRNYTLIILPMTPDEFDSTRQKR